MPDIDPEGHIPVFVPHLGPEVYEATAQALDFGYLGLGPLTKRFEDALASWLDLGREGRHVVATNSCTAALHLATLLAGAGPGDEVICPAFTYVAAHQAVSMSGADVVFCDVDDGTFCLDPDKARALVGERTKAIMVCHYAGAVGRLDEIYGLADEHGLRVIEDAAHALGSRHRDRLVGSFGDLVCFSFGPVKTITTLEGGAIVTPRVDEVATLHQHRLLGVDKDTEARYESRRAWEYDVVRPGFRYHLGSIPSAVGLAQLELLDTFVKNRRDYCRAYDEAFAALPGVTTMGVDWEDVGPFIYPLRVPAAARPGLVEHLRARGIDTGIHFFMGAHGFSQYRDSRRGDLSVTERVCHETLTLPLWSFMDQRVLDRVIDGVQSFFA